MANKLIREDNFCLPYPIKQEESSSKIFYSHSKYFKIIYRRLILISGHY